MGNKPLIGLCITLLTRICQVLCAKTLMAHSTAGPSANALHSP
ncbi:hypothetical protein ACF3NX_06245 [Acetobacter orientalis]